MRHRSLLAAVAALLVGLTVGSTAAQTGIPNGVFVRESNGTTWLVLKGQRVGVPVWQASDADIQAIPASDQWAVLSVNDDGAMVGGGRPAWLNTDVAQPAPAASPTPVPTDREVLTTVAGQRAISDFGSVPQQATVREMTIIRQIPAATDRFGKPLPPLTANGKFVVVAVQIDQTGKSPVCCVASYYLRDYQGRTFSDDIGDAPATQAMLTIYPANRPRGDIQPSAFFQWVLVFDVPLDSTGYMLAGR